MVVLENAFVYMVGDSWDEWVMKFWYAEPEIRWVTFRMQNIEQTEKFAIAYATDVTNVHGSWLPYGMPEVGVRGCKLFTIAVPVGGHRSSAVGRNMVLATRRGFKCEEGHSLWKT
jgi:hypothetical protein